MCKHPASECKPIEEIEAPENDTVEEDNDTSEDEDDDSDSYYTESSVGMRTDSDSDGESASGHRVTQEMVLLLMLKDHGAITEEKYAEKAEKCDKNFRPLIPPLPRSNSLDTIDYTKDLSDEESNSETDENVANKDDVKTDKELEGHNENDTVETSNRKDTDYKNNPAFLKSALDFMDFEESGASSFKDDDIHAIGMSIQCNQENRVEQEQQRQENADIKETIEVENKMQSPHPLKATKNEVFEENQRRAKYGNEETLKSDVQENYLVTVLDKIIETNTNATKDTDIVLRKAKEDFEDENHHSKHKNGEMLNNILQENNLDCLKDTIINNIVSHGTTTEDEETGLMKPGEEFKIEKREFKTEDNLASEQTEEYKRTDANISIMEKDLFLIERKEKYNDKQDTEMENDVQNNNLRPEEVEIIEKTNDGSQDTAKQDILNPSEESKSKNQIQNKKPAGKITKSFKYIIKKLIRENRIPKEDEEDRISDEYGEDYGQHLLSFASSLDRDYKNNTLTELSDSEDEDTNLREFAIFLNFYSPSSYKYILETYNTPLPELKVLYSWYLKDDYYPGLTESAFKILKEKCSVKKQTCCLMFIDVFLKNDGRYCDQVDYGQGEYFYFIDKAVLAYIFVLVSLDEDWKMPIGYILARNVPAETQAEYIRICLTHCFDAGVDVVAVTLDTLTPAECLGCSFQNIKSLKTTFKHPSCDRHVAVWIDPCLALKSARQTLKVKGVLKDDNDDKIRWNLIRKLRRLHTDDEMDLENPEFFEFRNHIAKIGLTSETFSKSLIEALNVGEKLLPDMFTDIEPTKRYIAIINMLYDILHSRLTIRMRNIGLHLHAVKKYLIRLLRNEENKLSPLDRDNLAWKRMQGYRYFLKGEPACGLLGFLICIESFKHLCTTLVRNEKKMNCLNPQRLCKIQAENLVNNLRAYDWDPDSLSGERFQRFYKRLFEHLEKNPQFSDQSIPLEHWRLNNRFSPAVTIKLTSGKRSYDDVYSSQYKLKKMKTTKDENRATKLVREYSKAMDTETDLAVKKNMVGFLAGWIASKFAKCLKCEACIDSLCTDKKLWFHKFITLDRIYALCLPSKEIFQICWECEKTIRLKGSPARLRAWVLRQLAPRFPWSAKRSKHAAVHHIHLARAVIVKYMALRIPAPFSEKDREKIVEMFQRFTTKESDDSCDKYRLEDLAEWLDGDREGSGFKF